MSPVRLFTSPKFERNYKKLSIHIKVKAEEKERIFVEAPFDSRLRTHKLHGKDKEYWAYWVDRKYRIMFLFLNDHEVLYVDIGTHDEVY